MRDGLEELYRIVAVVSLPQTAFAANGAGVKSSVLILRKQSADETYRIKNLKQALQEEIKQGAKYETQLLTFEKQKKAALKQIPDFGFDAELSLKALKETPEYKTWHRETSDAYAPKIEALRSQMREQYETARRQSLDDYPIFMAIAENIGYNATGKPIAENDFPFITQELTRFIEAIEKGKI